MKNDLLSTFAASEAADTAEDISEGARVNIRLRTLEAADFYRRHCDRRAHFQDVVDAIESAMAARGLT